MLTYVVRVWVPDRPGALGQVASRIGAVHGDVVGIDILERGAGMAIDELVVTLASDDLVDLLVSEIGEVDGVAVEEIRPVAAGRPETAIVALEIAARLVELEPHKMLDGLCVETRDFLEADWVVAMSTADERLLVELGAAPAVDWLGAFIIGSRHLEPTQQHETAPHDLAWASLDGHDVAVVAGRATRAFRSRERQQLDVFGRIAGGLLRPAA
ncbi:MAG: hypothetical protein AB7Q42_06670 [Acidimicrobiia bacterium]